MSEVGVKSHPLNYPSLLDLDDNVLSKIVAFAVQDGRFLVFQQGHRDPAQTLASVCKRLRRIVLSCVCTGLRIRSLCTLSPPLQGLLELDIGAARKPGRFLWMRSAYAQRHAMSLASSDALPQSLQHLGLDLSGLRSLDMVGCHVPDFEAIVSLKGLRQLAVSWRIPWKRLDLVAHRSLNSLAKLSALTALVMLNVPYPGRKGIPAVRILRWFCSSIATYPNLRCRAFEGAQAACQFVRSPRIGLDLIACQPSDSFAKLSALTALVMLNVPGESSGTVPGILCWYSSSMQIMCQR
jgi:hypothetical protein